MKTIDRKGQEKTPYIEAYKKYLAEKNTPFDLPGHEGNIRTELDDIIGHKVYEADLNSPRGMDNILQPSGPIKEAEELYAKACNADDCKFLINGSTSGNLIMLMSALQANDKIILPRNVHKSVINGLILSGAVPVFIMPEIDPSTEIAMQPTLENWKKVIDDNPDAKAVFIINPTYFGSCCDIKKVTSYAHKHGMLVLVDEAHGSHFYFSKKMPCSAMDANADMATLSIHKGGGSLTQTSVILTKGKRISDYNVTKSYNMITTTSPSSILIASLDAARKWLVFKGSEHLCKAKMYARRCVEEINKIPGFMAHDKAYFLKKGVYDFDETKLIVEVDKLTINGFEVFRLLKDKYHVQPELSETYALLFLFAVGTKPQNVDILVNALKAISHDYYDPNVTYADHHYNKSFPKLVMRPRSAFHAPLKKVSLEDCEGQISKEAIMIYPPGIPIIVPGEAFDKQVIDTIKYYKSTGAGVISENQGCDEVNVVDMDNREIKEFEKTIE
ncbi:MAG: aminotransferase class I/II-fold pyridoxal phosphate-dependent enzyme [Bacilli bacterium]|jgi:lysine decarboxylase